MSFGYLSVALINLVQLVLYVFKKRGPQRKIKFLRINCFIINYSIREKYVVIMKVYLYMCITSLKQNLPTSSTTVLNGKVLC